MLNFCVFTFILYAVGGSVKTILFGGNKGSHKQAYVTGRASVGSARAKIKARSVEATTASISKNVTPIKLKNNRKKRLGANPKRFYVIENCSKSVGRRSISPILRLLLCQPLLFGGEHR